MKKVLLLTLCVLIALPSLALAGGKLNLCGQAFVFGIFGAPTLDPFCNYTKVCWYECTGSLIGDGYIGPMAGKCVYTTNCGDFCFNLCCYSDLVRLGTVVKATGSYFQGFFSVCGQASKIDVKCGPGQDTTINAVCINLM